MSAIEAQNSYYEDAARETTYMVMEQDPLVPPSVDPLPEEFPGGDPAPHGKDAIQDEQTNGERFDAQAAAAEEFRGELVLEVLQDSSERIETNDSIKIIDGEQHWFRQNEHGKEEKVIDTAADKDLAATVSALQDGKHYVKVKTTEEIESGNVSPDASSQEILAKDKSETYATVYHRVGERIDIYTFKVSEIREEEEIYGSGLNLFDSQLEDLDYWDDDSDESWQDQQIDQPVFSFFKASEAAASAQQDGTDRQERLTWFFGPDRAEAESNSFSFFADNGSNELAPGQMAEVPSIFIADSPIEQAFSARETPNEARQTLALPGTAPQEPGGQVNGTVELRSTDDMEQVQQSESHGAGEEVAAITLELEDLIIPQESRNEDMADKNTFNSGDLGRKESVVTEIEQRSAKGDHLFDVADTEDLLEPAGSPEFTPSSTDGIGRQSLDQIKGSIKAATMIEASVVLDQSDPDAHSEETLAGAVESITIVNNAEQDLPIQVIEHVGQEQSHEAIDLIAVQTGTNEQTEQSFTLMTREVVIDQFEGSDHVDEGLDITLDVKEVAAVQKTEVHRETVDDGLEYSSISGIALEKASANRPTAKEIRYARPPEANPAKLQERPNKQPGRNVASANAERSPISLRIEKPSRPKLSTIEKTARDEVKPVIRLNRAERLAQTEILRGADQDLGSSANKSAAVKSQLQDFNWLALEPLAKAA